MNPHVLNIVTLLWFMFLALVLLHYGWRNKEGRP
jgi:hypothetical protein